MTPPLVLTFTVIGAGLALALIGALSTWHERRANRLRDQKDREYWLEIISRYPEARSLLNTENGFARAKAMAMYLRHKEQWRQWADEEDAE